jgi:choline kinase
MITIIIADGFKKGMKSRGCVGLLPYNKKNNLFEQQRDSILGVFPRSDIVYIYGFDAKRFGGFIEDTGETGSTQYILNSEYSEYNHGHSLYLAKDRIAQSDECLILLGYEPVSTKIIKAAKKTKKSSVLLDTKNQSKLGCVLDNNTKIISHIFFDLDNHISDIYLLKKPEINILIECLEHEKIHNMFLFEIMNNIIARKGKLEALQTAK